MKNSANINLACSLFELIKELFFFNLAIPPPRPQIYLDFICLICETFFLLFWMLCVWAGGREKGLGWMDKANYERESTIISIELHGIANGQWLSMNFHYEIQKKKLIHNRPNTTAALVYGVCVCVTFSLILSISTIYSSPDHYCE